MAKVRTKKANEAAEEGFWDRPVLLNLLADLFVIVGVAILAWAAANSLQRLSWFQLREVVVTGTVENVTRSQLEQAARAAVLGNFFTVDLDEVRAAYEKLPWVRKAEVRRRWPAMLVLTIEEHKPVAHWRRGDGDSRLVNDSGEVFAAANDLHLPLLAGPEGSASRVLRQFDVFSRALSPVGRTPTALTLSSRDAWQLKLDDGVVVELGRDEAKHSLDERLERFITWYRPALDKTHLTRTAVVDMRYPNGFALRPIFAGSNS